MLEKQEQEDAEEEIKLQNTNPFYNYTAIKQPTQQNSNNYLPPKPTSVAIPTTTIHHQSTLLSSSPLSTLGTSPSLYHNNQIQSHHYQYHSPLNNYSNDRTNYEHHEHHHHLSGIPILHTPPLSQSYLINNLNNKKCNEIIDGGGEGMASGYGMVSSGEKSQNIYNNFGFDRSNSVRSDKDSDCTVDGTDLNKDDQG